MGRSLKSRKKLLKTHFPDFSVVQDHQCRYVARSNSLLLHGLFRSQLLPSLPSVSTSPFTDLDASESDSFAWSHCPERATSNFFMAVWRSEGYLSLLASSRCTVVVLCPTFVADYSVSWFLLENLVTNIDVVYVLYGEPDVTMHVM